MNNNTNQPAARSNQPLPRLFEGDFLGKPVKVEYGMGKGNKPSARITMRIVEGPRGGTDIVYEANFKPDSIKYAKRDMMAVGWQGKSMNTFVADVNQFITSDATVQFNVRIASYTSPETGKTREWNSVGGIGYVAAPLQAPTADLTQRIDQWFADAEAAGGDGSGPPNAPGNDADIPF